MIIDGYLEILRERRRDLIYLAWHIEAFARQKRIPALKKVLKANEAKKTQQKGFSTEELIKIAKSKGLMVPKRWGDLKWRY